MAENPDINWPPPPAKWSLAAGDVHIWTASLRPTKQRASTYALSLSPDENTRASRFLFDRDRNRFIARRGLLRTILGRYLGLEPGQIKFHYSSRGKPSLAGLPARDQLHFNIAHSEDLAVYALSKIPGVGIDLERLRPMSDAESIAEHFFSVRETELLKSLPSSLKQAGFFNLWTRKEAWLKATGEGICNLLGQVEVSLCPGDPAQLIRIFSDEQAAANWRLEELQPASGYLGALAVPAREFEVHCWSW